MWSVGHVVYWSDNTTLAAAHFKESLAALRALG